MEDNSHGNESSNKPPRINWQVNEFCAAHRIGRTLFYKEVKSGALKIIKVGDRTLVPDTEAKAWQAKKQQNSHTQQTHKENHATYQ